MSRRDVCAWCGAPATTRRILEPEETRRVKRNGQTVSEIARVARVAHVCDEHNRIFEREDRVRTLIEQRAALERRRRSPQANVQHLDGLIATVNEQLHELGYVETHKRPRAAA